GAVDKITGETLPWNPWDPEINPLMVGLSDEAIFPFAITVLNDWVIIAGRFRGPFATLNLVAFQESKAAWAWGRGGADTVFDLQVHNGKLYVAGQFTKIGGDGVGGAVSRTNLAELDPATFMQVTAWNPQLTMVGDIRSLAFQGNSVFAVGTFKNPNPF